LLGDSPCPALLTEDAIMRVLEAFQSALLRESARDINGAPVRPEDAVVARSLIAMGYLVELKVADMGQRYIATERGWLLIAEPQEPVGRMN
jgi:hypothetical protein